VSWLWLISVGVTDVQFPVWSQDEYGQWTVLRRFETGRAGVRAMHEGLLVLLHNGDIRFDDKLPRSIDRNVARDLRLEFVQDDDAFLAAIRHPGYRISDQADTIPNAAESQLPLYCPKVEALLPIARQTFGQEPVSVLVLNTRRAESFSEAASEPVASGPLVAWSLAERLGLEWGDGQGQVPERLAPCTSTWIDILTGDEAMEDPEAQANVVRRINDAMRAWIGVTGADQRVAVTAGGGMPPLKPLIERVPATRVGQRNVWLLDQPERGPATAVVLSYDSRVTESEALRFHCAEALRTGDYAGAYGLASRIANRSWAAKVCALLGPLLDLPGAPLRVADRRLEPFALSACRIETRLCMNDVAGALVRFGTFIDSLVWALIKGDARIRDLRLTCDRDDECLEGVVPNDNNLFAQKLLERDSKGRNRHGVTGLAWRWPPWLAQRAGGQLYAAQALDRLRLAYSGEPRTFRNLLVHGTDTPVDLGRVQTCLVGSGLIDAVARPFGQNFLPAARVSALLTGLGASDLSTAIGKQLSDVLATVIEG